MALVRRGDVETVRIHGHERAYLKMGEGPALLLIHGIGSRHETWLPVVDALAKNHTVIAPDLLGHGQSAKPRADYSIGGYANGMRDLLTVLGIVIGVGAGLLWADTNGDSKGPWMLATVIIASAPIDMWRIAVDVVGSILRRKGEK